VVCVNYFYQYLLIDPGITGVLFLKNAEKGLLTTPLFLASPGGSVFLLKYMPADGENTV
jgi:hypothetical protein